MEWLVSNGDGTYTHMGVEANVGSSADLPNPDKTVTENIGNTLGITTVSNENLNTVNQHTTIPSDAKYVIISAVMDGGERIDSKMFILPQSDTERSFSLMYYGSSTYVFFCRCSIKGRTIAVKEIGNGGSNAYINVHSYK